MFSSRYCLNPEFSCVFFPIKISTTRFWIECCNSQLVQQKKDNIFVNISWCGPRPIKYYNNNDINNNNNTMNTILWIIMRSICQFFRLTWNVKNIIKQIASKAIIIMEKLTSLLGCVSFELLMGFDAIWCA